MITGCQATRYLKDNCWQTSSTQLQYIPDPVEKLTVEQMRFLPRILEHSFEIDLLLAVGTRLLLADDAPTADAEFVESEYICKARARQTRNIQMTAGQSIDGLGLDAVALTVGVLMVFGDDLLPAHGAHVRLQCLLWQTLRRVVLYGISIELIDKLTPIIAAIFSVHTSLKSRPSTP